MGRDSYSFRLTVEECRSISTVSLNRNNLFKRGIHDTTISWNGWRVKDASIGLQVLMLENDEHVRFQYTQTDNDTGKKSEFDYKVKLEPTHRFYGGHRWWFICPLVSSGKACNRRVEVLYLGGGRYFGCRHCYNLTYESQKESGKYDRFFEKLGFDPKVARRALFRKRHRH